MAVRRSPRRLVGRDWLRVPPKSTFAACTKPNLVNFGERLCDTDHSLATVAFLGQSIGDSRYVFDFFATATVAFLGQRIGDSRYGFAFFATGDVQ